jgi:hypothetical protein
VAFEAVDPRGHAEAGRELGQARRPAFRGKRRKRFLDQVEGRREANAKVEPLGGVPPHVVHEVHLHDERQRQGGDQHPVELQEQPDHGGVPRTTSARD